MKERDSNLDLIRTVAIILVVFTHSLEDSTLSINQNIKFFLYYLCRCGVPLFLLLSGSLVFNKEIKFKKITHMIFVTFFWLFTFNVVSAFVIDRKLFTESNIKELIIKTLQFNGYFKHLWYLKQILLIYVLLFIKSKMPENISTYYIYSLALLFSGIYFDKYNVICFIGLVLTHIGYLIYNKKNIFYINKTYSILTFILSFCLFILSYEKMNLYTTDAWWYWNIFILISSLSLFEILLNIKINNFSKFSEIISKYSFGIYLFHIPCIYLIRTYMPPFYCLLNSITLFFITFSISFFLTFCFKKTKLQKLFI